MPPKTRGYQPDAPPPCPRLWALVKVPLNTPCGRVVGRVGGRGRGRGVTRVAPGSPQGWQEGAHGFGQGFTHPHGGSYFSALARVVKAPPPAVASGFRCPPDHANRTTGSQGDWRSFARAVRACSMRWTISEFRVTRPGLSGSAFSSATHTSSAATLDGAIRTERTAAASLGGSAGLGGLPGGVLGFAIARKVHHRPLRAPPARHPLAALSLAS